MSRGKLITQGSSVSPLTWQGKKTKRNRVSFRLVGSPIKGGKCLLCNSKWATLERATPVPVTSGNRCSCASAGRWLSPFPLCPHPGSVRSCPPWNQSSAPLPVFRAGACFLLPCFAKVSFFSGASPPLEAFARSLVPEGHLAIFAVALTLTLSFNT